MYKLLIVALLLLTGCSAPLAKSIVMLRSPLASCTGFEVRAPSGKEYLLTAAHCSILEDDKHTIQVNTEYGTQIQARVIAIDTKSDLMLLEAAPGLPALDVAKEDHYGERVRVLGHGFGLPLWEVSGYIIGDASIMDWVETICSVGAMPGHSGSPVVGPDGLVVGVLSTSNGVISGFVRLSDLQAFLQGY